MSNKNGKRIQTRRGQCTHYRVSQKFVPLISCTITFDQNFIFSWAFIQKNDHPFHSKAFVLLYKFETSWALLGRLSSAFFWAISGASNFKHFKELFMTLSGLGLLTM